MERNDTKRKSPSRIGGGWVGELAHGEGRVLGWNQWDFVPADYVVDDNARESKRGRVAGVTLGG